MTVPAAGTRGASAAAGSAVAAERSAPPPLQDRAAWTARFEKVRQHALCPNCLDADDGTAVKGSLSLAPAQSQPNRANGSAIRLHCSTCKRHMQSEKIIRAILTTAELNSPIAATTDMLNNPQFTSLSERVAFITTEMQKPRDENERLRAQPEVTTQVNPVNVEALDSSPLANLVRDLLAQQATVAAEARATAKESASTVAKLTEMVNESAAAVAKLAETVKELMTQNRNQPTDRLPRTDGGQTTETTPPDDTPTDNQQPRPSFVEIAKRNLPQGLTLHQNYEGVMTRNARDFRDRFVKPAPPPPRPEHFEIPTTALKPIYGSGLKHQGIGDILRGFRSVLPAQATRGISLYGTTSFELLVEESVEHHAREILTQMGMRLTDQSDPLAFAYPSGTPVTDNEQIDRCATGAFKRWQRAQFGCPFHPVKTWYTQQLNKLAEKFPHVTEAATTNQ